MSSGEFWAYLVCARDESADVQLGYLVRDKASWSRLTRFRLDFRDALLTAAYLSAFRGPAGILRIGTWNRYGRLIKDLYRREREKREAEFKQAEEQISANVQIAFEEPSERISKIVSALVPGVTIRFEAGPFTLDEAHKAVTLFLDDGVPAPYYEKGSGLQSLVVIGMFWFYCDEFHQGGTLLLLEEPENYLHPHGRRLLVSTLRQFVKAAESQRQVLVSSHSEELVRGAGIEGPKLIRKLPSGESTIFRLPVAHGHAERWRQILRRSPEVVFARHAILVEGGEVHLLSPVADRLLGEGQLDRSNISVVRVEGKEDFKKHVTMLESLDIQWTILTDKDFLAKGVEQFNDRLAGVCGPSLTARLLKLGIVVNQTGQLEDMYTANGQSLVASLGKDRAALRIGEALAAGGAPADWFTDVSPFEVAVRRAVKRASGT
jgi:hypothetical protein